MLGQLSHIDVFLGNVAVGYPIPDLIADQIAPVVPVDKDTDLYRVWGVEALTLPQSDLTAPKTEVNKWDFTFSKDSYACKGHAMGHDLAEEEINRADDPEILRNAAVFGSKQKVELGREKAVADLVQTAANYASSNTTALTSTARYDSTAPDIIGDIRTGKKAIRAAIGKDPDTIVIANDVYIYIRELDAILQRLKYGGTNANPAFATPQALAEIFGVEKVVIGQSFYNSAKQGQTPAIAQMWSKSIVLAYVGPTNIGPNMAQALPTAFRQFTWKQPMNGAAQDGSVVRYYPQPEKRCNTVEYHKWYDAKATFRDASDKIIAAYAITTAIS